MKTGYLILPKRTFNSPLIMFANFEDGSHVNLIRLSTPYADGTKYAIHETTKSPFCSNGLFKTIEQAKAKFNLMVYNNSFLSPISSTGETGNITKSESKAIGALPNFAKI